MVLSCTAGFPGSVVDKTIIKFIDAMVSVNKEGKYSNYEYKLNDKDGNLYDWKGAEIECMLQLLINSLTIVGLGTGLL